MTFEPKNDCVALRDAGAMVGQEGGLEKGICTDYDVIMMSEFKPKGSCCFRDCGARDRNHQRDPCFRILS